MTATVGEAVAAAATAATLRIGLVGQETHWLSALEQCPELGEARLEDATSAADVLHVGRSQLHRLRTLRRAFPRTPLLLDLTGDGDASLGRREAWMARAADGILVGSRSELKALRHRYPRLAERAEPVPRPVDSSHVPLAQLHATRDAEVKRFRRLHRLAGPVVLFGGPYTRSGGLHLLVDIVYRIRERNPELRLAAVPHGAVEARYRDDCERRILALGHHGIVEWAPSATDLPLWYGLATVVCSPALAPVPTVPAKLAAAAARPFVGSRLDGLEEVVADGHTGFLVATGDDETLQAALEALLADGEEAARLGTAARSKAEAEFSAASAARRLGRIWAATAAGREGATAAAARP